MKNWRRSERGGTSLIEMTLVGIPMIFILISVFELSRGMWTYQSLAAAVKAGTRYTIVHGADCAIAPNACTVTVANIASQIQAAGPGLIPGSMTVTFTPASGTAISESLTSALSDTTTWPPSAGNANKVGQKITISAVYPFNSAIAMFWPGAGSVPFSPVYMSAYSGQGIQF